MKTVFILFSLCAFPLTMSFASEFDFEDPKGVNTISILLDSLLEPFSGIADGVSGVITYDPEKPEDTAGFIEVALTSVTLGNQKMTQKMLTTEWLNADAFPVARYAFSGGTVSTSDVENTVYLDVEGNMALRGVTNTIPVTLKLTHIPDGAEQRGAGDGDLLVVRSVFDLNRSAFGIRPGKGLLKVADNIKVHVAISGYERNE